MKELCSKLSVVVGEDGLSKEAQRNATVMFMSLLRSNLASKRVLQVRRQGRGAGVMQGGPGLLGMKPVRGGEGGNAVACYLHACSACVLHSIHDTTW